MQLFEEPFVPVAESSGVSQSVMTTAIFVYKTAFSSGDFGTASAISAAVPHHRQHHVGEPHLQPQRASRAQGGQMSTSTHRHAGAAGTRWTAYAMVAIGALIMVAPFYFMFVFATHTSAEILSLPPPRWFGTALLHNLELLQERLPFWRNIGISLYGPDDHRPDPVLLFAGRLCVRHVRIPLQAALFTLVMASMIIPPS
jgi:ABC-type sugar transport system permease subunit